MCLLPVTVIFRQTCLPTPTVIKEREVRNQAKNVLSFAGNQPFSCNFPKDRHMVSANRLIIRISHLPK
jgi:hypothetical protein